MSERLSITINPTDEEWDALLKPFQRQGAKDPLIAELRESLHAQDPEWANTKIRDNGPLAKERLEELAAAAQAKADKIATLPEGDKQRAAHATAQNAAQAAKKLLAELNFNPGHRGGDYGADHHAGEHANTHAAV